MVDHQLGRVLRALARTGLMERTLIVLTADHGEMLGDHWLLGKNGFWPEAFHVPLIVRHPTRQRPGHVVDAFSEHVDLMPTLASIAGEALPEGLVVDGEDLLPVSMGQGGVSRPDNAIFWSSGYYRVVRAGDWKLHEKRHPQ